jgi:hypothetical protein
MPSNSRAQKSARQLRSVVLLLAVVGLTACGGSKARRSENSFKPPSPVIGVDRNYPSIEEISAHAVDSSKKLYYWVPRFQDIPPGNSEERTLLEFLLANAEGERYKVEKGDSLDRIIRNKLFVSWSNQPRAYRLYFNFILSHNEILNPNHLAVGEELVLPTGPHYSAFESKIDDLSLYRKKFAEGFGKSFSGNRRMDDLAFRSLGHFTKGFVKNLDSDPNSSKIRRAGSREIERRRILPARRLDPFLDSDTVKLAVASVPDYVQDRTGPQEVDAIENQFEDCKEPCASCRAILQSDGIQFGGAARLMLADTGIDASVKLLEAQHVFQDVPAQTNGPSRDADLSEIMHGTFVYSETVEEPYYGPLPRESVLVARVATPATPEPGSKEKYKFQMDAVHEAIRAFYIRQVAVRVKDKPQPVWVVNLSIEGTADPKDGMPLTQSDGLLFVAAAGNGRNNWAPVSHIFPRLNSQVSNILIVGALGPDRKRAWYSNWHATQVDLFVRGSCVCGLGKLIDPSKTDRLQLNGTSQAAPIAATAATIVADHFPDWTAQQLKWRLISTSNLDDAMRNDAVGGDLNLPRALNNKWLAVRKGADGNTSADIQLDKVDVTQEEWKNLLAPASNTGYPVLRIHQTKNCSDKKSVCFRRLFWLTAPTGAEADIKIDPDAKLRINGAEEYITARDLKDLILPIDWK